MTNLVRQRVAELRTEALTSRHTTDQFDEDVVWVCDQLNQAWNSIADLLEKLYHCEAEKNSLHKAMEALMNERRG